MTSFWTVQDEERADASAYVCPCTFAFSCMSVSLNIQTDMDYTGTMTALNQGELVHHLPDLHAEAWLQIIEIQVKWARQWHPDTRKRRIREYCFLTINVACCILFAKESGIYSDLEGITHQNGWDVRLLQCPFEIQQTRCMLGYTTPLGRYFPPGRSPLGQAPPGQVHLHGQVPPITTARPPPPTVTAAYSTHPTGMLSCLLFGCCLFLICNLESLCWLLKILWEKSHPTTWNLMKFETSRSNSCQYYGEDFNMLVTSEVDVPSGKVVNLWVL